MVCGEKKAVTDGKGLRFASKDAILDRNGYIIGKQF